MNRRRGSLLVMTLWIVTILGALSVAVARYLSTEVRLTRYRLARHEARELARSGVSLAQQLILQDKDPVDWSRESWAEPLTLRPVEGRTLTVTITDEERKLNVNTATFAQLQSLLLGDGTLAQAIVDYVDDDPLPDPAEDRLNDTPPYYAKDGPIAVLEELNDLQDLDEDAHALLEANTTPHTGTAQNGGPLNINTATRLAMLAFGLSEYTVNLIDEVRDAPNGRFEPPRTIVLTLQDHNWTIADPAQAVKEQTLLSTMTMSSFVFLVVTEGMVEQPEVRVRIQAVIQRSTDPTSPTPKIIAWRES